MTPRLLALFALFCVPSLAHADTKTEVAAIDARLKTCMDKDSSNVGMKDCTDTARDEADKLLNKVYKATTARLKDPKEAADAKENKEMVDRLVAAEKAWVAFRDKQCDLQGIEMLNGTGEGLVILDCLFSMTKDRIKSLDELRNAQ